MSFFDHLKQNMRSVRDAAVLEPSLSLEDKEVLKWLGIKSSGKAPQNDITYYTCLKKKAETLGSMPLKYYQKTQGKIQEAEKDSMAQLLTFRPNEIMTPATFGATISNNMDNYGNAYVWIQQRFTRLKYGGELEPTALWIMPSERVKILIDDVGVFGSEVNSIYYWYQDKYNGQHYVFSADEVLHFKNFYTFDGIRGASVQEILRASVDGLISAQEFQNNLFKSGMTGKAVLNYTGELSEKAKENMRSAFENLGAGAENAGRIIPVPPGFKLEPIDFKLSDSQFMELKKYSALQLAAAFGIKPNQINDYSKSSYANSEQQQLAFLTETMLFPITQMEQEINYKCLSKQQLNDGFYYKFNDKVLLRTDSKTQTEVWAQKIDKAMMLVNEVREMDDLPPLDNGDVAIVNGTYIPLSKVGDQYNPNKSEE